jgi:cytochrome oxidase Cu insertion factor (SCO1/SenC/PrrC family)
VKLTPRAKMLLIAAVFAAPIVASLCIYMFMNVQPTGNYGELLLPPASVTTHPFAREDGTAFRFGDLKDRWILVASDSGQCPPECRQKLRMMRQVRLALGRDASRVTRVFVVDDVNAPEPSALGPLEDLLVAVTPRGLALPVGMANDRAHIYLVDPRGNVMMRWPASPDFRRMLKDLQTLLKASQIG